MDWSRLSERAPETRATRAYTHDLAISAVSFDALLVADLVELMSPRLRTVTTWPCVSSGDLVARVGEAAVSLSWLAGRGGAVSDGRLLVVEWAGVAMRSHGLAALAAAEPLRERVYRAEATDSRSWRWRVDSLHGRAYSSEDLVGDLLSGMTIDASLAASHRA